VTKGILFAEAEEISLNPKLGTYAVRVTDEHGELIATFQGMTYRKSA
jgi:acyl-CoA thioesterase